MTEQVLRVLGKLDERNTQSIIWVTLEQAKLIIYLALLVKHHKCFQFPYFVIDVTTRSQDRVATGRQYVIVKSGPHFCLLGTYFYGKLS